VRFTQVAAAGLPAAAAVVIGLMGPKHGPGGVCGAAWRPGAQALVPG